MANVRRRDIRSYRDWWEWTKSLGLQDRETNDVDIKMTDGRTLQEAFYALVATAKQLYAIDFVWKAGFVADDSQMVYDPAGVEQYALAPANGSLIAAALVSSVDWVSGALLARPTKNGSYFPTAALDTRIDTFRHNDSLVVVAPGVIPFTLGDKIGVNFGSSIGWAPVDSDVKWTGYFFYD